MLRVALQAVYDSLQQEGQRSAQMRADYESTVTDLRRQLQSAQQQVQEMSGRLQQWRSEGGNAPQPFGDVLTGLSQAEHESRQRLLQARVEADRLRRQLASTQQELEYLRKLVEPRQAAVQARSGEIERLAVHCKRVLAQQERVLMCSAHTQADLHTAEALLLELEAQLQQAQAQAERSAPSEAPEPSPGKTPPTAGSMARQRAAHIAQELEIARHRVKSRSTRLLLLQADLERLGARADGYAHIVARLAARRDAALTLGSSLEKRWQAAAQRISWLAGELGAQQATIDRLNKELVYARALAEWQAGVIEQFKAERARTRDGAMVLWNRLMESEASVRQLRLRLSQAEADLRRRPAASSVTNPATHLAIEAVPAVERATVERVAVAEAARPGEPSGAAGAADPDLLAELASLRAQAEDLSQELDGARAEIARLSAAPAGQPVEPAVEAVDPGEWIALLERVQGELAQAQRELKVLRLERERLEALLEQGQARPEGETPAGGRGAAREEPPGAEVLQEVLHWPMVYCLACHRPRRVEHVRNLPAPRIRSVIEARCSSCGETLLASAVLKSRQSADAQGEARANAAPSAPLQTAQVAQVAQVAEGAAQANHTPGPISFMGSIGAIPARKRVGYLQGKLQLLDVDLYPGEVARLRLALRQTSALSEAAHADGLQAAHDAACCSQIEAIEAEMRKLERAVIADLEQRAGFAGPGGQGDDGARPGFLARSIQRLLRRGAT